MAIVQQAQGVAAHEAYEFRGLQVRRGLPSQRAPCAVLQRVWLCRQLRGPLAQPRVVGPPTWRGSLVKDEVQPHALGAALAQHAHQQRLPLLADAHTQGGLGAGLGLGGQAGLEWGGGFVGRAGSQTCMHPDRSVNEV